jgi:hypothetical protein
MIVLDLSILNQKGTPMFNSDTFANRPAFGIVGRIFISTDTKEFYRDTGTSWELIGGPGSGTITGSGAATQVAFWNGASTITGSNNLFWDSTNNYLGINTSTPGNALDVHSGTISTLGAFNQTTATNNTLLAFLNSNTPLWRIGNFYTGGANDFSVFDVVGNLQQFTIVKTTGQTFIGAKTTASGRLVINSATSDAHLQIIGANAPSIRIDNAGSGSTQQFVIGNATFTNNFIQGSVAGQFCITTGTAGDILFGMWQTTNASEVMRITTTNRLLIGTSVDNGNRLQVSGSVSASAYYVPSAANGGGFIFDLSGNCGLSIGQSSTILQFFAGGSERQRITNTGLTLFNTTTTQATAGGIDISSGGLSFISGADNNTTTRTDLTTKLTRFGVVHYTNSEAPVCILNANSQSTTNELSIGGGASALNSMQIIRFWIGATNTTRTGSEIARFSTAGNLMLGTTTDAGQKLQVNGNVLTTNFIQTDLQGGLVYRAYWGTGNNRSLDINIDQANGDSQLTFNTTYNSGWKYFQSNYSSRIASADGIYFSVSALGTAGNTITWNDAMSIKSNGNVLIGTTTNGSSKLRIVGLPTSAVGLSSGDVYSNAGILTIVP